MKIKLLKRIIKNNKLIDIWQDTTLRLLPNINISMVKCNYKWKLYYFTIGWLFWRVSYFGDYKPCCYNENDVKIWMNNYSDRSWH